MRGLLVVRRALSEPLLLLAAFVAILLATSTLVALTLYASTITEAGVRRTMATAAVPAKAAAFSAPVTRESFRDVDGLVREQVRRAYLGLPAEVTATARSDTYVVPGQRRRTTPELLTFGLYQGLERHATLVSGTWPREGAVVEAAVSQPVAGALGLRAGQTFTTEGRVSKAPLEVRISGVFQLDDPFGARWFAEPLLVRGSEVGNYTTHGPLVVAEGTFLKEFAEHVSVSWLAIPDLRDLPPADLATLAAGVAAMKERLAAAGCVNCGATSQLPEIITQLDTAALVARSTMLIPVLQLILLAGYALLLTARLLADHRRMEVALLRARGAGSLRLAALTGGEALLVAVPCAVAAPFLAPVLLTLTGADAPGPLGTAGADAPGPLGTGGAGAPEAGAFLVAGLVALACAGLLALPALAGARRTYVETQTARVRTSLIQRAGADVVLVVVAGLAIWQLTRYGAPVTATAAGGLGIDPLIVSGPALALLTGGLLSLRLVPLVSGAAERLAVRRSGLAPALGAMQVSRRPLRYAGPALLLTMAVAIGGLSLATRATWQTAQTDQAAHATGTDLRISDPPENQELGVFGRGGTFAALPGLTAISPVFRGSADVGGTDVTMLGVDAAKLGGLMRLRRDLSADGVPEMAARLLAGRPDVPVVPLGGDRLRLKVRVTAPEPVPVKISLVDGQGVWREFAAGPLRPGEGELALDLRALTGRSGTAGGRLGLRGLTFELPAPARGVPVEITVTGLAPEQGARWVHAIQRPGRLAGERLTPTAAGFTVRIPAPRPASAPSDPQPLVVTLARGDTRTNPPSAPGDTRADLLAAPNDPRAPLPIVVTRDLAAVMKARTGQVTSVEIERRNTAVRVAGIVDELPSTAAGRPAVLLDLPTVQARAQAWAQAPKPVTEWWAAARDGETGPAVDRLRRTPAWGASVVDLPAQVAKAREDPLAGGLAGALTLGFAAALLFAVLGFLVSAVVSARERAAELTVLRALGMSFRQLLGLLVIEQAFVVGLAMAAGLGLAAAVGGLVVPRIVLTGQAVAGVPAVVPVIPWGATLAMAGAICLVLFAVVAGLAGNLRRGAPMVREEL
ncbi:FtsX-like permease family protein [Nonomuraea typhae]|uniref:FtsX-like permease family protein n=1 Tax=Nonomuraea typhae TaxID=2603600 RepID=UPI0012FB5FA3|nr:FtsX-like permease family protein [Nonomuraea typhae]